MTSDIEERARRAGASLRDVATSRATALQPPPPQPSRPRGPLVLAVALVAVLVAASAALLLGGGVPVLEIDPDPLGPPATGDAAGDVPDPIADADGWLPVPEVGEAIPAYLDDLTPVFVSHPEDGEVLVLDPINPHDPSGLDKLVAFCTSSGWFEDLYHGSRFSAWGDWTGGPAPRGLSAYPVEVAPDGARVRINGPLRESPGREERRGPEQEPSGSSCERWPEDHTEPHDAIGHRPPVAPPALPPDQIPSDRWAWATLVLGGEADRIVVCEPDGTCRSDAPRVTFELGGPGDHIDRAPVTYLVRQQPDGRIRVLHPADPHHGGFRQIETTEQPLLSVPERGTTVPHSLRDGTPIFVSHTGTGDVHVLAASPPDDVAHLVGWCAADESFHGAAGRYAPDGSALAGGAALAQYGIALETIGETRGIRITDPPDEASGGAGTTRDARTSPTACPTRLLAHAPTDDDHIIEHEPEGNHVPDDSWRWVRLPISDRDGQRFLCSLGDSVPDCGVPNEELGFCNVMQDGSEVCHPLQDLVVATPGVDADDEPRLMLVRADDEGRTVEVRIPAVSDVP